MRLRNHLTLALLGLAISATIWSMPARCTYRIEHPAEMRMLESGMTWSEVWELRRYRKGHGSMRLQWRDWLMVACIVGIWLLAAAMFYRVFVNADPVQIQVRTKTPNQIRFEQVKAEYARRQAADIQSR